MTFKKLWDIKKFVHCIKTGVDKLDKVPDSTYFRVCIPHTLSQAPNSKTAAIDNIKINRNAMFK